jgi:hypothetical protein
VALAARLWAEDKRGEPRLKSRAGFPYDQDRQQFV